MKKIFLMLSIIAIYGSAKEMDEEEDIDLDALETVDTDVQTKYRKIIKELYPEKENSKQISRRVYLETLVKLYTHFDIQTINEDRVREKNGEDLGLDHHEAVLMLKYLERYMRGVKGLKLGYEFAKEEILSEKPLNFAKDLIQEESFGHDKVYHENKDKEYEEYLDNLIDSHLDL